MQNINNIKFHCQEMRHHELVIVFPKFLIVNESTINSISNVLSSN